MTREEKIAAVVKVLLENGNLVDERGSFDPAEVNAVAQEIVKAIEE